MQFVASADSASELCNCKAAVHTPQEGNTENYFRSLHASSSLENFRRENFRKVSVVTKIMKILYYENLEPYGISCGFIKWGCYEAT